MSEGRCEGVHIHKTTQRELIQSCRVVSCRFKGHYEIITRRVNV